MFMQEATATPPYDQDERFAELDDLVTALEQRWAAANEQMIEND